MGYLFVTAPLVVFFNGNFLNIQGILLLLGLTVLRFLSSLGINDVAICNSLSDAVEGNFESLEVVNFIIKVHRLLTHSQ